MTAWMAYATIVGLLFTVAALALEAVARSSGRPLRWTWAGAMASTLLVPLAAPLREGPATTAAPTGMLGGLDSPGALLSRGAAPALRLAGRALDPWLAEAWLAASVLLAVALVAGLAHLRWRARRWPAAVVRGSSVRLSAGFGPAVVGVLRPQIVLPGWMLASDPTALDLALLHEEEHRRSGDVRLLFAAASAVVVAPWNPALWWQLRRLRAAVELDCDARVLARGAGRAAYGTLLLDLAAGARSAPLPFAALSNRTSLLERRLRMITLRSNRIGRLGVSAACALALAAVGLACEAAPPTDPSVEVTGLGETVVAAPEGPTLESAAEAKSRVFHLGEEGAPLIYIDGIRILDPAALADLAPETIERIEVLKGGAAQRLFGEEAADGVIQIFKKQPS